MYSSYFESTVKPAGMCGLKALWRLGEAWRTVTFDIIQVLQGNALVLVEVKFLEGTLCIMYPFLLTLITFLEIPLGSSKPDTVSKFSVMLFTSNTCVVPASLPQCHS